MFCVVSTFLGWFWLLYCSFWSTFLGWFRLRSLFNSFGVLFVQPVWGGLGFVLLVSTCLGWLEVISMFTLYLTSPGTHTPALSVWWVIPNSLN